MEPLGNVGVDGCARHTQGDESRFSNIEKRMDMAEAAMDALVAPEREPIVISDLLPQPKRGSRSA